MNSIDVVVLVLIGFNAALGLFRGAAWQVLRLASIGLGIWCAVKFGPQFLALLPSSLGLSPETGMIPAQLMIFAFVYLLMFGVTHLLQKSINKVRLGSVDKLLGATLGGLKGAFFCMILLSVQFVPQQVLPDAIMHQFNGHPAEGIPKSRANQVFRTWIAHRVAPFPASGSMAPGAYATGRSKQG